MGQQLQQRDFVLMERVPEAVQRERDSEEKVSARLLPRTMGTMYYTRRKVSEHPLEIGDGVTHQWVTDVVQPVSGDMLVHIEFDELTTQ